MVGLPGKMVVASGNAGKLREIRRIFAGLPIELVAQSEFAVRDVEETGTTFVENALLKARNAMAQTGLPALADDSGLIVAALEGRPGVHSARYAGPEADDVANIDKLLAELEGVVEAERAAAFHCTVCLVTPDGADPVIATGEWSGRILEAPAGASGFGYDPVFFDPELGRSAAEMDQDKKNARSHRARALTTLAGMLGAD